MPSVCLCMIVRDESEVIERCIASVHGLVDYWVICDTGSTDGTQDLIRHALADVPGELHETEWRNFGHNRSELMRLARGKADYLLLVDADQTISVEAELPELTADMYMVRHAGDLEYRIARMVRGDRKWWFEGSTHEYLACSGETTSAPLDAIVVNHYADGGARADKFERDIRLLTEDLERDPQNGRAMFYLAQSHRDLGDTERARDLYAQRAALGGWAEEVYYSLLQVGVLEADLDHWPEAMAGLVRAWEFRPQRLEAVYELAWRLRARGEHHTGLLFAQHGLDKPAPDDILFVAPWVYRWGILFEYSVLAYWAGDPLDALNACDRLLAMPDLPEAHREHAIKNREWCVSKAAVQGHRMKVRPHTSSERRERRLAARTES